MNQEAVPLPLEGLITRPRATLRQGFQRFDRIDQLVDERVSAQRRFASDEIVDLLQVALGAT